MDAARKAKLGQKWTCYSCQVRFYDLNKPEPLCPKCQADQRQSPAFEKPKSKTKRTRKKVTKKKAVTKAPLPVEEEESVEEIELDEIESVDSGV